VLESHQTIFPEHTEIYTLANPKEMQMIEQMSQDMLEWLSSIRIFGYPSNMVTAYVLTALLVGPLLALLVSGRRRIHAYRNFFDSIDWMEVEFSTACRRTRLQRLLFPFKRNWVSMGEYKRNRWKYKKTGMIKLSKVRRRGRPRCGLSQVPAE